MDERLPSTEFQQIGGSLRAHWALSTRSRLVGSYARTNQDGGERYDQLLGGDGNLISELNDLSLDFGSVRFERLGAGVRGFPVAHLLAEQPARGARQPGRQRQQHRDDRPRAGAHDGPRLSGQAREAAVLARGTERRRRYLLRTPHVGVVQREPGDGRGLGPPPARAGSGDVQSGGRVRAGRLRRRSGALRLVGASGSAARRTRPARPTARSSTARRCGPTTR